MLYTHAAAAIAGAVLAGVLSWTVQGWRYGEQIESIKKVQAEATLQATREARATESRRSLNVQEAQNAAAKRAQVARADADRARSELDRLRDTLSSTSRGLPGEPAAACPERAATVSQLLSACAAEAQELARAADGHANDARTLIEAWPK